MAITRQSVRASAAMLRRVEGNDPTLRSLVVGSARVPSVVTDDHFGEYRLTCAADLEKLGDALMGNTNLEWIAFDSGAALAEMVAGHDSLWRGRGLKRNTSIFHLGLSQCDLSGSFERRMANYWLTNNDKLKYISLDRCVVDANIFTSTLSGHSNHLTYFGLFRCNVDNGLLASILSEFSNLKEIRLTQCNVDDRIMVGFTLLQQQFHQLQFIDLDHNNFGRTGCESIAILLQDPDCQLVLLDLSQNPGVDDHCVEILARSLGGNCRLKELCLTDCAVTINGLDAFSESLCDASSVQATFGSNHVLSHLDWGYDLPPNLSALLALNRGTDKKQVAARKILRVHRHFDAALFHGWDLEGGEEWDLKVLPVALGWFDRVDQYVEADGSIVDAGNVATRRLSTIFQFTRAVPAFASSISDTRTKRKRRRRN